MMLLSASIVYTNESHVDLAGIGAISGTAFLLTDSTRKISVQDATETFLCVPAACPKR